MPLAIPTFLPQHGPHADSFFPSSEEEHTDQWISVSRAPVLQPQPRRRSTDTSSDEFFASVVRTSSPVRHRLEFEIEPEAESGSWAKNVESRLAGLSPTTPRRRSRSVDELGRYPRRTSVKERVAQVQAAKPEEVQEEKESRSSSITRRASAPLLNSSGSKKRSLKPIDTAAYVRTGITPPGTAKPSLPAGQLSTFGTVYIPPWDKPNDHPPRPSTAPLPTFDFGINVKPEQDEHLGGVHYSTYGSRVSEICEDSPFSDVPPSSMPFADSSVPIPASLMAQFEQGGRGHKRGASLANALLKKVGSGAPSPVTPSPLDTRSRGMTPGSITPTADGSGPTTPAIPDFLAASRTDDTPALPKPKLKTRASLLSIAALASRQASSEEISASTTVSTGHGSHTPVPSPQPRPKQESAEEPRPRSVLMRLAAKFTSQNQEEEREDTGAQADESYAAVDDSFTSVDGMLDGMLKDLEAEGRDSARKGTGLDGAEFGVLSSPTSPRSRTWSKLSATFGGRSRRQSETRDKSGERSRKESVTSRTRFDSFGARSRLDSLTGRARLDSITKRTRADSTLTRRRSADVLSAEGATEGTVMYGVGEEMLRLMFGGGVPSPSNHAEPSNSVQTGSTGVVQSRPALVPRSSGLAHAGMGGLAPIIDNSPSKSADETSSGDNSSPTPQQSTFAPKMLVDMSSESSSNQIRNTPTQNDLTKPISDGSSKPGLGSKRQAPEPRERTRSLPRRVSPPRGSLTMLFTPPDHEASESVDIGLLPDFGGSLDLRFSNPAPALAPASNPPAPRRPKGHRRGASSKENARTRPKNRSRSKSVPLGLSSDFQKSLAAEPIKPGILIKGNTNANVSTPGRVVIVNSATTPSPLPRKTGRTMSDSADTSLSVPDSSSNPGVIVTAATPPGPRRSLSMPLDAISQTSGAPLSAVTETTRGSLSRGTSVQFAPESLEASRRSRRAAASSSAEGGAAANANGKGKRKVEREETDIPETGRVSPSKKPRLGGEEVDITFMGEPLFGGVPQVKRGRGSVDRASSHYSGRSYHHPSPGYPYPPYTKSPSPNPTPSETPDPERASIPMRAIVTPRVQSLYGAPPASDYVLRRQSLGDIQRPKSRASARDIPRPKSQASARSYVTGGAKSNMTSAQSHVTRARSNITGARSNVSRATTQRNLKDRLPRQGWCFIFGFILPFLWWYASFARAERGYYGGGVWSRDVEAQWEGVKTRKSDYRDDGRIDAHTWRFRCRLMAVASLVIYVPVIVLAAVFAR
ncbi:hypothetical protein RhiJN_20276 [Ceratobasidium sp. AG-Ba]|nr:hypothetical protein RhiJN_20276 [Ceratobasidium sp. AG-Ba]